MKKRFLTLIMVFVLLVAVFSVPAFAANESHVLDAAGVLTDEEFSELDRAAIAVSERYSCGVYIVTVEDYTDYSDISVQDCAERIYVENDLGAGEQRNGVLLLLSMADRDYWLLVAGTGGFTAFTDYGQELLCDEFLDNFRDDDWYGGFSDYVDYCGKLLNEAANGTPVDIYVPDSSYDYGQERTLKQEFADMSPLGKILMIAGAPCIIALIVCLIFGAQMKTARKKSRADEYIPAGGVNMRIREDIFTHRTETREKIQQGDSSGHGGGTSVHSSGFSGRGGKF